MGVDFFYCPDCNECLHSDCFLRCNACEEKIDSDPVGYVCNQHKANHITKYRGCNLILCESCAKDCEFLQKDPAELSEIIELFENIVKSFKKKRSNKDTD